MPPAPANILAGKVALVTGGGRGIGKAIAAKLAAAGARVVIASRKREILEAAANDLNAQVFPGLVVPIECHLGRLDQVEALVKTTENRVGPIDILVNNSATNVGQGSALNVTDDMLDKIIEVNVKGPIRLLRLTVPSMIARGGGSIINIVSIAGISPMPGSSLYSFTKAGLIMLTKSWAREFSPQGVRVNAIAPGLIQTDFSSYYWQDQTRLNEVLATQSIPRLGQPQDIAGLALFFASPDSSFITGQLFVVDGGATL